MPLSFILLAVDPEPSHALDYQRLLHSVISAVTFSTLGLIVLGVAIAVMSKLLPLPFWKEIEEDQNIALGIMVGSIVLGVALIIAASIHG